MGIVHFPLLFQWEMWFLVYFVCACVHMQFVVTQEIGGFPWLFPEGDLITN